MTARKTVSLAAALAVTASMATGPAWAECITIQDAILETCMDAACTPEEKVVIEPGFNFWGYNYQARVFNGTYCDAYRNADWCQAYRNDELIMKWNDAWLSNKDCDGDYLLDRHFGSESYIGSGAWLTNHTSGMVEVNGRLRKWTYFVKIVAVPEEAVNMGGIWYADGVEIGPSIWGQFAIVEEVMNDPSNGAHGVLYHSPSGPGFGHFD